MHDPEAQESKLNELMMNAKGLAYVLSAVLVIRDVFGFTMERVSYFKITNENLH